MEGASWSGACIRTNKAGVVHGVRSTAGALVGEADRIRPRLRRIIAVEGETP